MTACIAARKVIVERNINASGAKTVGNGAQAYGRKAAAHREAQKPAAGECDTERRSIFGPGAAENVRGRKACDYCTGGHYHGDGAGAGEGDAELGVHGRPRRAEYAVRQADTDIGDIYYKK